MCDYRWWKTSWSTGRCRRPWRSACAASSRTLYIGRYLQTQRPSLGVCLHQLHLHCPPVHGYLVAEVLAQVATELIAQVARGSSVPLLGERSLAPLPAGGLLPAGRLMCYFKMLAPSALAVGPARGRLGDTHGGARSTDVLPVRSSECKWRGQVPGLQGCALSWHRLTAMCTTAAVYYQAEAPQLAQPIAVTRH